MVQDSNYIFLSHKDEVDYKFYDMTCFSGWVDIKKSSFINNRTRHLREEAQFELDNPWQSARSK
jgi:hypothetical protein